MVCVCWAKAWETDLVGQSLSDRRLALVGGVRGTTPLVAYWWACGTMGQSLGGTSRRTWARVVGVL